MADQTPESMDSPFADAPDAIQQAHQEIRDVAGDPLDDLAQHAPPAPVENQVEVGAGSMAPADEQMWSTVAHASGLVGLVLGGFSFLGPLLVYLLKKDASPRVRANAAEALNFQITSFLALGVAALTLIVLIGFILLPIVFVAWLAFTVIGAVKTSNGEDYRYPINIRMVT